MVTTGSQAEPRAQLSLAAREASQTLRINRSDLVLYSAKMIPGGWLCLHILLRLLHLVLCALLLCCRCCTRPR